MTFWSEIDEQWIIIADAPNYAVSSEGRVQNLVTGRILKDGPNSGGYPCVKLYANGKNSQYRVHRLVMNAFCPTDDPSLTVNHIDRDKTNNSIQNLEWVSHNDNIKHAAELGWLRRGRPRFRIVETGQEFFSISACARVIGGERRGIERCLDGRNQSYRGYTFEFV